MVHFVGFVFWLLADVAFKVIGRLALFIGDKAIFTIVLSARAWLIICSFLPFNLLFPYRKLELIYFFLRISLCLFCKVHPTASTPRNRYKL